MSTDSLHAIEKAPASEGTDQPVPAQDRAWQDRLLPLMGAVLVFAALFFAALSIYELRDFYSRVEHRPTSLGESFTGFETTARSQTLGEIDYLRFKVMALLEADALQRRYHQANATMLARVWTRQIGFLTGMLLSIIGAAFILGQLRDGGTQMSGEAKGVKATLTSSSPGLVLAVLGTGLMALTIWVPFGVDIRDENTYLRAPTAPPAALPPPGDLGQTERDLFGTPPSSDGSTGQDGTMEGETQ